MIIPSPLFGENVYVFDESDNIHEVDAIGHYLFSIQESAQFGDRRFLLLFKPGTYDVNFNVGFYTEVMGTGKSPEETRLTHLTVNAQWLGHNNATCNFWRSVHNLSILSDTKWAVSQAAPMRRLFIKGSLELHDKGYASGGFLADSLVEGVVDSGPQQQWFSRNNQWGGWKGYSWNMVFMGINDLHPNPTQNIHSAGTWPTIPYTDIPHTPIIREKPYLVWEHDAFYVAVPDWKEKKVGTSWKDGTSDPLLSLDSFYIAKVETDGYETAIQQALDQGKNIIFTPGIYHLHTSLKVTHPSTIIMGLGLATLVATEGNVCIQVGNIDDVIISGLLLDAGPTASPTLLEVGTQGSSYHAPRPLLLSDLFFRVGGTKTVSPSKADTCVIINTSHVIGDHFWVWRADHGTFTKWHENTTINGLIVNGHDVTIYGLFVEHFHQYNTIWNGERGRVYFYQNEIPYDVPYQKDWMSHHGTKNGYAQYKVSDHVKEHYAIALGVYGVFLHNLEPLVLASAIETPTKPGIIIEHAMTMMIVEHGKTPPSSAGTVIQAIVNDRGENATSSKRLQRLIK